MEEKREIQYEGHGKYALYVDDERAMVFDNFDDCLNEYERTVMKT